MAPYQIVFIVACSLVGLAIIIIGSVLLYKYVYYPKKFANVNYRDVYKIVQNNDYRLINKFIFKVEEEKYAKIDHIVFGDKYFYLIFSRYYKGDIKGKSNDKSLVFIPRKGKKQYTVNQFDYMKFVINKLCIQTALDRSLLIGICLVNDDCKVNVQSDSDHLYMIPRKELKNAIKSIEARDIGALNDDQLQNAVLVLNKMNRKK